MTLSREEKDRLGAARLGSEAGGLSMIVRASVGGTAATGVHDHAPIDRHRLFDLSRKGFACN